MAANDRPAVHINKKDTTIKADGWDVTLYTDPLCCWSWAMREDWNHFIYRLPQASVYLRMAGLLPSWQYFADHISAITKPIQMGPEWMHARTLTGVPIDERIWITDPPGSSFPACIAVKAAGLQLPPAAKWYFDAVQKAVLTEQRNIARTSVLLQIAEELARENSRFNCHRFADDLLGLEARQEFKQDVMDWKYLQIGRLPAIIIRNGNGRRSILSGYQPLEILSRAADLLDKG